MKQKLCWVGHLEILLNSQQRRCIADFDVAEESKTLYKKTAHRIVFLVLL